MVHPMLLIAIGLLVGVYSGLMGLGGGTIMIPIMVLLLRFTQHEAVATSLAVMTLPVFLPAVITFFKSGQVRPSVAGWIALGVLCGSYFGARLAQSLSDQNLKLVFGFILTYIAGYTIFQTLPSGQMLRSMVFAGALTALAAVIYVAAWRWAPRM